MIGRALSSILAAALCFLIGFIIQGNAEDAARGVWAFGLMSATAWSLSTAGVKANVANTLNFYAALFAAVAVGFSTPPDKVCKSVPLSGACYLRDALISADLVSGTKTLTSDPAN